MGQKPKMKVDLNTGLGEHETHIWTQVSFSLYFTVFGYLSIGVYIKTRAIDWNGTIILYRTETGWFDRFVEWNWNRSK